VLKYPGVEQVTLVELDPQMTRLFTDDQRLRALNGAALASPRVRIVNTDAYGWLENCTDSFDIVIIDFPDPTNFALGKLYTTSFYERVDQVLAAGGWMVVQTTSPLVARKSYWTVVATLEAVGFSTTPLHVHVPSFGEWGFVIAGRRPWLPPTTLPAGLRFLTLEGLPALRQFPPDMARVPAQPNRLSNQALVSTFEEEWGQVAR
jgi:spermidine synthase